MSDLPFIPFANLMPYLVTDLPGCPPELKMQQAVEVARQFCFDTSCWTFDLDPMFVRASQTEWELEDVPCGAEIIRVKYAAIGQPTSRSELKEDRKAFALIDRTTLRIAQAIGTDISKGLAATVVLRPTSNATDIDARVFNDYYMAFVDGIISMCASMPKKPWTNYDIANYRLLQYEAKKAKARSEILSGGPGMKRTLSWKPRYPWA